MRSADWLLLCVALLLEGVLIARYWGAAVNGAAWARVEGPAGIVHIPLDRHTDHHIVGHLGTTTLRVGPAGIAFVASPCRQKICIRRGTLQRYGSSHACVPNRISLSITGTAQGEFDAFHQ